MKKPVHHMEIAVHCSYLGLVAVEAHSTYGVAAGVLLVVVILHVVSGEA